MATKQKTKPKSTKSADSKKLSCFEDMGKFFGMSAQKFRVFNMRKPFALNEDGTLKGMTPQEVLDHCEPLVLCGQRMHMQFAVDPNKASYKNSKKEKKKG